MREKPILFSGAMVRAILDGRKTMTRRVVKPQPNLEESYSHITPPNGPRTSYGFSCWYPNAHDKKALHYGSMEHFMSGFPKDFCPYSPGDRLWVRETWIPCRHGSYEPWARDAKAPHGWSDAFIQYRADFGSDLDYNGFWRPSIFMPRWASRLTLEVTDVKCERLQSISEEDAEAEGVESPEVERYDRDWSICPQCGGTRLYDALSMGGAAPDTDCLKCDTHAKRFRHLWDSINGRPRHINKRAKRGRPIDKWEKKHQPVSVDWASNPWVWAISFKVVKP